ncbi:MAG: hypothetical protein L0I89_06235 [Tetragenococcus halophilus]|nr:hypothetical protein [Tetragenococcus halophilus]MDN5831680.1 hypothetical protein [Tetragenococcus halophilus]MDN6112108.1 hypothetical protein [Tetragenococcus halophilus]MDN6129191.1 hypothetical protein [Tetragenococcus halophilus]MDN6142105.1 hypothetical protein [Tetragenococcus halophilus]
MGLVITLVSHWLDD